MGWGLSLGLHRPSTGIKSNPHLLEIIPMRYCGASDTETIGVAQSHISAIEHGQRERFAL
jgi:hypothetical protein